MGSQFPTHHWIGDLIWLQVLKTTMNRFIALSAVLAVAAAEADPQLLYPALVSPHAKADALVEYPNGAKVPADTLSVQAAEPHIWQPSHSPMGTQLLATTLENVKQKQKPTLMLGMGYTEDIMDLDTDTIIL